MYEKISSLNQVLEAIEEVKHCFTVKYSDGFVYIKYKDSFVRQAYPEITATLSNDQLVNYRIRRECRGIAFRESDGKVVIRRLHKFFNLNERQECNVEAIDFNRKFYCLDKMDGTLISPLEFQGKIRFTSQQGFSPQSELADSFVISAELQKKQYEEFCRFCIEKELTPSFEFVSDKNKIVIKYTGSDLILLAVRENESGCYSSYEQLCQWAKKYNIPVVSKWNERDCVIIFEDNHEMYKCKTNAYSIAHSINPKKIREQLLWRASVTNVMDDLISMIDFSVEVRNSVRMFNEELQVCIEKKANSTHELIVKYSKMSQSDKTKEIDTLLDKNDQHLLTKVLQTMAAEESTESEEEIADMILDETQKYILSIITAPVRTYIDLRSDLYNWLDFSLQCIHPYHIDQVTGLMVPNTLPSVTPLVTVIVDDSKSETATSKQGKRKKSNKKKKKPIVAQVSAKVIPKRK